MAIHPTAVIGPHAEIDDSVEIGPYVVIDGHVRIGQNTTIGPHAYLTGFTEIGQENQIHAGAVIGHVPQDTHFDPHTRSYLRIGNRNIFREYCNVHRGTQPESATVIGDDNFIMGTAHIGHNCEIGNHVVICNCALVAGHAIVGDRAFISGGVVIHQFTHIGRVALLSGNCAVSRDVPPFVIVAERNAVHAINTVGLRRAEISSAAVGEIKRMYRLFYLSGLSTANAIKQIQQHEIFSTPEAQEFLAFVESSPNGICPAGRR